MEWPIKNIAFGFTLLVLVGLIHNAQAKADDFGVGAQEVADTIRINTGVVFMDALVKDKRTGVPIADLKPENFEIYDDGNLRPVCALLRSTFAAITAPCSMKAYGKYLIF